MTCLEIAPFGRNIPGKTSGCILVAEFFKIPYWSHSVSQLKAILRDTVVLAMK